ncbi:uncharacterized protein LOC120624396 isoform X1 [Pararge aegeria]|uniref:Jg9777 protein n=1 Tax=Pararge aegeria aegeria TaxID=348720 RepID=A0A8S4RLN3_9NEOP|nr:uncharacterized protein LOC120624396 isoform X1 [Pararge aegeria]CAH2237844.1 jg9777 [Pararge aegeria aegeria]
MLRLFAVLSLLSISSARPYETSPQNVVTVPPNCPAGQEWINGACRDIWNMAMPGAAPLKAISDFDAQNMITVPPNCPPGQQWINGQCRDVWRGGDLADSVKFQKLIGNLWANHLRNSRQTEDIHDETLPEFEIEDNPNRNIISVPNHCPEGYRPDAFGICRKQL